MKPFNLERALAGDPVINGSGETVFVTKLVLATPVGATLLSQRADGSMVAYHFADGRTTNETIGFRLHMAPKEKTVWVNLYEDGSGCYHDTEEEANKFAGKGRVGGKAHPIVIEE